MAVAALLSRATDWGWRGAFSAANPQRLAPLWGECRGRCARAKLPDFSRWLSPSPAFAHSIPPSVFPPPLCAECLSLGRGRDALWGCGPREAGGVSCCIGARAPVGIVHDLPVGPLGHGCLTVICAMAARMRLRALRFPLGRWLVLPYRAASVPVPLIYHMLWGCRFFLRLVVLVVRLLVAVSSRASLVGM